MIHIDCSAVKKQLTDSEFEQSFVKARDSFSMLQSGSGEGTEWLGWRRILADPNDAMLEQLDSFAASTRAEADVFLVCGIGGSYLGARAVIEALTPFFDSTAVPEIIFCGHQLSGEYLEGLINHLEKPNGEGEAKSVFLNVISKSGTTLETALSFRLLREWMINRFPGDVADRIICTTGPKGGALNKLVSAEGFTKFEIPEDVGGRFSALTPVGLLPIAIAGIDIRTLFYEAVSAYEKLERDPQPVLKYAACKHALHEKGICMDVITSFEPQLNFLLKWVQQLLGESEGKEGKGMFPAVAGYSTDLHSIGQFVQDGPRKMMETFVRLKTKNATVRVPESKNDHDGLNYLAGKSFHEINTKAFEGTYRAHQEGGVPSIVVSMDELNAQHVGEFLYFYELLTAVYCYCLEVNPFNQPGVEGYKEEMYNLLEKP